MSEHHNLPNTVNWRARVQTALRALNRSAGRYRDLTLREAPVRDVLNAIGRALYNVEIQTRHRHHRLDDGADLTQARQHLTEAAKHLSNICARANRGTK